MYKVCYDSRSFLTNRIETNTVFTTEEQFEAMAFMEECMRADPDTNYYIVEDK